MRRLVAIVLLLLLPLQAIWAAAEPYCQHEQGRGTAHVGHHMHQDQDHDAGHEHGTSNHVDDAETAAKAFTDHDHHCCGSLSMVSAVMPLLGAQPRSEWVAAPLASYAQFDATRIERPNWPTSL